MSAQVSKYQNWDIVPDSAMVEEYADSLRCFEIPFISGTVLVNSGLLFLVLIEKAGTDKMDREMLTLGESQLHVWHPLVHWQEFDRSLRYIFSEQQTERNIIHINNYTRLVRDVGSI